MSQRVRIGSCAGPADAALVRSMFEAHGIPAIIGGERHAGLLAGFGGGFISLDIFVASDDVEDATALLADLRAGERADDTDAALDDAGVPPENPELDAAPISTAIDVDAEPDNDPDFHARLVRRRRTVIAVALALCFGFGTAHMYTRAWVRGALLAALEITGFARFGRDLNVGVPFVLTAIVIDLVGAVLRIRNANKLAPLPRARVRR